MLYASFRLQCLYYIKRKGLSRKKSCELSIYIFSLLHQTFFHQFYKMIRLDYSNHWTKRENSYYHLRFILPVIIDDYTIMRLVKFCQGHFEKNPDFSQNAQNEEAHAQVPDAHPSIQLPHAYVHLYFYFPYRLYRMHYFLHNQ